MSEIPKNAQKILIIDDEKALRISLKKILERAGFIVDIAQDILTARKSMSERQFDLLLVDIILPKMNGIEVVRKLKEEYHYSGAVVFITGEPNLETALDALRIGANNYLEKPISQDLLIEKIKNAINSNQNQMKAIAIQKEIGISEKTPSLTPNQSHQSDICNSLKLEVDQIFKALAALKKKYGENFNEDQRALLNTIARNISKIKDIIDKV